MYVILFVNSDGYIDLIISHLVLCFKVFVVDFFYCMKAIFDCTRNLISVPIIWTRWWWTLAPKFTRLRGNVTCQTFWTLDYFWEWKIPTNLKFPCPEAFTLRVFQVL